jgi:hypothetical protein
MRGRWLVVGLLASGGAGLLTLTSAMHPAFAYGSDESAIMGGTGNPLPDATYVTNVTDTYITPNFSGFTSANAAPLYTPEQFWPVTPNLGNMTFDQSVAAGVGDLDTAIRTTYAGDSLTVFGYSESATVATDEMRDLMASGYTPSGGNTLNFVLVGDPNNPDGGILERFAGLYIPGLDVSFNGATPPDTPFPTDIYSIQYDGIADAPQFPINPVSDANALAGYFEVHSDYPILTPGQVSADAVQLQVSPGYDGVTHYFMIPTQNLPLLDPLRDYLPVLGNPLADLIQPDMRVIVDLGYGDGFANVPTTAGLLPLFNPAVVGLDLAKGAEQGVVAALVDVGALPASDLPNSYPYLPDPDSGLSTSLLNLLTGNSQMGILGLLTGGLITGNSLPDLLTGSDPLVSPGLDLATLLPGLDLANLLPGLDLATLLSGLDLPSSLLGLPEALASALDPALFLAPLAFLGL